MKYFIFVLSACLLLSCGNPEKPAAAKKLSVDELYKKYPDSLEVIIQHGNLMLDRYDYDHALEDGAKAFRLDSNNVEARFLYANALNNRAERTVSDVLNAQRHFQVVLEKKPDYPEALVALATTFAQSGDNDEAFQLINRALRINKNYRDAYVLKGSIYLKTGNTKLAKSSYQTAIDQDPKFYEAYLALGDLYMAEKDPLALQYYQSAVDLHPTSIDAMYALAYCYQQLGKSEEALEEYRAMVKREPSFAMSYFQQGWIKQFQQDEIDSAQFFYESALQREPQFVEAWHNLGMIYEKKHNTSLALQSYGKALKYDPDFELSRKAADRLGKR